MATALEGRDLYLHYQPLAGAPRVQSHRVWDAERFFAAQVAQYGPGPKKRPEEIQVVTVATRADYLAHIKK